MNPEKIKIDHYLWPEIEFVKEWPTALGGKKPLRLYRAKRGETWRWFFGFPEEMVKPICLLLETTLYWGEEHIAEHEGFYIWWLMVTTDTKEIPRAELESQLKWHLRMARKCVDWYESRAK